MGIVICIVGMTSNYNEKSLTALIIEGILNSASARILLYMALVDLIEAFTNKKKSPSESRASPPVLPNWGRTTPITCTCDEKRYDSNDFHLENRLRVVALVRFSITFVRSMDKHGHEEDE
ncbi:Zinc transporter 8 [Acorus gramineus]|uniref:Zinc transporter 8 n=1 Tax=Acorus gramineus TaxID=55184 RepID=A0AAV9AE50_ACOGR|nr:Zinc transporter 8 [Acorus gramineus]